MTLAPPADIQAAAARFAPAGAHVFLALERDATLGVVAWTLAGRPAALALRWRDGRWERAQAGGLRLSRGPARVRLPTLLHVRGAAAVWVDARPAAITGFEYVLLTHQRRGPHTVVELASDGRHALARAWSYVVA